jgi:hypothetical protein
MKTSLWVFVLLCTLNLNACMFLSPSAPEDLKFVSVNVVSSIELPNLIQLDIAWYNPTQRKVLDVIFSSMSDITEYRLNWGDTSVISTACQDWANRNKHKETPSGGYEHDGPLRMETSSLFWNDFNVSDNNLGKKLILDTNTPPFYYHFYLDITRRRENQHPAQYNLQLQPVDVCFQISSAEFMRPGAKTNVVIIPKDAIAAALASKP